MPEEGHSRIQYRDGLVARGLSPEPVIENPDGSRTRLITDPEGYTVSFWEALRLADEEVIQRFEMARRLLAEALVGRLMALVESGRPFRSNPYNQDRWVAILVRHLDNALDRCLGVDLAGRVTVRMMLSMLGGHVRSHVAQIRETRQVHGVYRFACFFPGQAAAQVGKTR